ncbi:MAG: hypothetical protein JOY71_14755 [Acetobacteraceae bacterium]|nr:hypothetical protein [Acetobacteraceae bacterium]
MATFFRAYRIWTYLVADIVRYGWYYLLRSRPDLLGFWNWMTATVSGWGGAFMRLPAMRRDHGVLTCPAGTAEMTPGCQPVLARERFVYDTGSRPRQARG